MATFLPFRGLRYNPKLVKDLSKVMAPPYDILSARDQDLYYSQHSNNIVKLDFGKEMSGDNELRNKYTRSAMMLKLWSEQGVLREDLAPGYYVVGQDFTTPAGEKKRFLGVIGLLKLEQYKSGVVKPHEKTLSKPKSDRLDLTRQTRANISQIFLLFEDGKRKGQKWLEAQAKGKAEVDLKTGDGVRHRLWPVAKAAAQKSLQALLAKQPVYIADGHHRYETMLNYAAERAKADKKGGPKAPWNYAMVALAPMQSPGMVVLPTHRMLFGLRSFSAAQFQAQLAKVFDLAPQKDLAGLLKAMAKLHTAKRPSPAFGLALPGASFTLLTFKKGVNPAALVKEKRAAAWKKLDVALLQAVILEGMLGMSAETIAAQQNLHYTKSAAEAANEVAKGTHQAALLLNPTRIEEVRDVSDQKDVMPQKSTYFLPKLLTGLVLRKIG